MSLVTVQDIQQIEGFEGRSVSSIHSFIKLRHIKPVDKVSKKGKMGGLNFLLFDKAEIIEALMNQPFRPKKQPINGNGKRPNTIPKKQTDDPLLGKVQPYRNIKCPDYQECLKPFIFKDGIFDCSKCEKKDEIDENWRYR